jgi:hypothetical protein
VKKNLRVILTFVIEFKKYFSKQARVLREEWERREELEKQQEEQLQLLEQETEKRKAFERMQREREEELQSKF